MKKVLFVTGTRVLSGAENINFIIINNLREKYDFYYVAKDGPIFKDLKSNNIKGITINRFSYKEIKNIINEIQPDIIHTQDYTASLLVALAKKKSMKLVMHLHVIKPWLKKINLKTLSLFFASIKANKIFVVSKSINNDYIFSKFLRDKIVYLPNPVDRDKILSSVLKKNNNDKKYDICCVARLSKEKRPFLFIDIIKTLKSSNKQIKSVWVGDGVLKDECIEYAKEKGVSENVEFVGFQKNPYKFMKESKIFFLPSEREGYPMVLLEALTLGLPCVATNVAGVPDIITDDCGRVCNNVNEYIDEINLLLNDKNSLDRKSICALKRSEELESLEDYINQIEKVYE